MPKRIVWIKSFGSIFEELVANLVCKFYYRNLVQSSHMSGPMTSSCHCPHDVGFQTECRVNSTFCNENCRVVTKGLDP